jgi:hypothetical protein
MLVEKLVDVCEIIHQVGERYHVTLNLDQKLGEEIVSPTVGRF